VGKETAKEVKLKGYIFSLKKEEKKGHIQTIYPKKTTALQSNGESVVLVLEGKKDLGTLPGVGMVLYRFPPGGIPELIPETGDHRNQACYQSTTFLLHMGNGENIRTFRQSRIGRGRIVILCLLGDHQSSKKDSPGPSEARNYPL